MLIYSSSDNEHRDDWYDDDYYGDVGSYYED